MRLEPIIEMPSLLSGLWRRFAVHLFEGKVTTDDMARIEAESEVWHAKIQGKLVEMVVIFPSDAKMTSEERAHMTRIIKRWEGARRASATVILAQGLVGAMHRSVLTGMTMIVPAPHPVKVFGSLADATRWLSPHVREVCGVEVKADTLAHAAFADELLAAVDDLAARFAARRAPTA
jgi:hypothetical protein